MLLLSLAACDRKMVDDVSRTGSGIKVKLVVGLTAIALAATFLATSTTVFAGIEGKNNLRAKHEASCKAQAAKKYSAIHFIKRNQFVNRYMGVTTTAKKNTSMPTKTGQRDM